LDFNQVNDVKLDHIANLSYFEIQAKDFIVNGQEQNIAFDAQNFDVLGTSTLKAI
jgi:uncharacterized membrane protein YkoI